MLLATVESWPQRTGLRTSDLLDVADPLRVALLRAVRSGSTTLDVLSEDLGVPEDDALTIAAALIDRGALEPDDDGGYVPRRPPARPRRATPWLDALDAGGDV